MARGSPVHSDSSPVPSSKKSSRSDPGHVPRPPNPFILFRSDLISREAKSIGERDFKNISRIAGRLWRNLSEDEKKPFREKAEQLGTTPLGEIVGYGQVAGPDPSLLTQPARAIQQALAKSGSEVGDVDLSGGRLVTLFGYLVAGLVLLPLGFVWSLAERSRGSTAVLMVAGVAQAFVITRVIQVWSS